jgi:precorrin-3B synthase
LNEPLPAPPPALLPRPSACPGLLRIVATRDGGLCRVKLAGGRLSAAAAAQVAEAALRHGNGTVELTNRANLQLRGITPTGENPLVAELMAAGLGPATPAADDVRNLMLSPMAGLDPGAALDTWPLAKALLDALEGQPRYHQLSPKFAIQVDGGETLAELRHAHDLWLSPLWLGGRLHMGLGLASAISGASAVAAVPVENAATLVLNVLDRFLALAGPHPGRMRELLQTTPVSALLDGLDVPLRQAGLASAMSRSRPSPLGLHPQRQAGRLAVGIAPPLGRLTAASLLGLADLAQAEGIGELRLTPWQGLLLPGIARGRATAVQAQAHELGLLVDPSEPLASLVTCTGSVGCARGLADTKADALALAAALGRPLPVHLSGCSRSCAQASVAAATLLAIRPGHYDLFLRDPTAPGFGRPAGRDLTLHEAAALLADCPRSAFDD